ncbi:MAG: hypothetical protein WKG06_22305 [Segetibacter sp.]
MAKPVGGSTHPYYSRFMPAPFDARTIDSDITHIDLTNVHLPPYGVSNTVAEAVRFFDARAAAGGRCRNRTGKWGTGIPLRRAGNRTLGRKRL